jgi:hypothetical protein
MALESLLGRETFEHENAGAPEKEHDALGQRSRLRDRDGERHHVAIERYRDSQTTILERALASLIIRYARY